MKMDEIKSPCCNFMIIEMESGEYDCDKCGKDVTREIVSLYYKKKEKKRNKTITLYCVLDELMNKNNKKVVIPDALYIPQQGQYFSCKWDQFTDDPEILKFFEEDSDRSLLAVEILNATYSNKGVEVMIILHMTVSIEDELHFLDSIKDSLIRKAITK